ncbi:hypothetical protein A9Q02_01040 [Candidatus Chloroploca asiatica]|uniref:Glycerophosphoryl diester phosphodiesterase membrane domain-containing protein n=2 Tax=Candidatus Chloroploca asiatica TaxID=1506545 RepID=A0A2H3KWQ5_9CHLR|nr:hypothetical protein A9Q02_01040 [Candidatus Chloroploca asiatica]
MDIILMQQFLRLQQHITPLLELLDAGLRLYRRHLTRFLLLVGMLALPLGAALFGLFLLADRVSESVVVLLILGGLLLTLPLSFYIMGALSRAAVMAVAGEPVRLRAALTIKPRHLAGMGCYGTLFLVVASTMMSIASLACIFLAYLVVFVGIIAATALPLGGGAIEQATAGLLVIVVVLIFIASYVVSLVANGAVYSSAIYALQPFVQDQIGVRAAMQRSLDLVTYRLGQNLLMFFCASLVFGAAALATTLAIGVLVPLPTFFLLGEESAVAQAITAAAWVTGLAAAMPLLPIWMALFYQQRRIARRGEDLAAQLNRVV